MDLNNLFKELETNMSNLTVKTEYLGGKMLIYEYIKKAKQLAISKDNWKNVSDIAIPIIIAELAGMQQYFLFSEVIYKKVIKNIEDILSFIKENQEDEKEEEGEEIEYQENGKIMITI